MCVQTKVSKQSDTIYLIDCDLWCDKSIRAEWEIRVSRVDEQVTLKGSPMQTGNEIIFWNTTGAKRLQVGVYYNWKFMSQCTRTLVIMNGDHTTRKMDGSAWTLRGTRNSSKLTLTKQPRRAHFSDQRTTSCKTPSFKTTTYNIHAFSLTYFYFLWPRLSFWSFRFGKALFCFVF